MVFQTQSKTVGKSMGETTEIPIHTKCVLLTKKCELLEPKVHNATGFDTYEVEIGKTYLVGCGNMTYKILVHGKRKNPLDTGFDIVETSLMPWVNYCKPLRGSGGIE